MDPNRPAEPFDIEEEREVSEDERQQILGQIDRAIQSERKPLDQELADVRPRKRGGLFPVVVNAAAVLLVVAGAFLLWELFEVRSEGITLSSAGFVSAEGSLLEALRQESEGLIRDKEQQIAAIEQRLQAMDRQTLELKAQLQSDLRAREQELRRRIEAELAVERDRLRAAGSSDSAIDRELRELLTRRERALAAELDQYRGDLDLAIQEKERELAVSRQELQAALSAATSERIRLAAEMTQREAELRAQFDRERESLRQEASVAERRLVTLQEAQRQERLLQDQLEGYYRESLDRLRSGDPAGAGEALGALTRLLDSPAVVRVPALLDRRALDRALVGALEELIALRAAADEIGRPAIPGPGEAPAAAPEEQAAARQRPSADGASSQERIGELELRLARLSADLAVASNEKARLERWKTSVDGLSSRYAEARSRARRLISQGGEGNLREAERLLMGTLRDSTAASILPGVADHLEQVDRAAASLRRDSGEQQGREAALTEVLRYLNYLSRGTGSHDLESQVMAQAREDPLYRAVIREIQILRAGAVASVDLASPYLLLGTVAAVSGSQVVIEPLGDARVAAGATVQIRRSDALDQEALIARGTVEQVRGGKIYARVDAIAVAGESPRNRDLVYIEPQ